MNNCKNCGKQIPDGVQWCSKECGISFYKETIGTKSIEPEETVEEVMKRDRAKAIEKFREENPDKVMTNVYGETFIKNEDVIKHENKPIDDKFRKALPESTEILEKETEKEPEKTFQDLNIELIQKALKTKTEIYLVPRRSHAVKGIPIRFDSDTYRIYVDTGRNIETVLLREIGHLSFPKELYNRKGI